MTMYLLTWLETNVLLTVFAEELYSMDLDVVEISAFIHCAQYSDQKCHIIRTKLSELIDSPFTKAQNRSKDHFDFEFLTTFSPGKKTESGELKTIQNST